MRYMLDTNICIYLIKKNPEKVLRHFREHAIGEIGISSITLAELHLGVEKSLHIEKNREALGGIYHATGHRPFDAEASSAYGMLRSSLEQAGTPIGAMDLLIAAHAMSLGATLVTNNVREFKRIRKLKIADWTS
jgi:tRNA(fMet)-specific endonuclease VapC